MEKKDPPKKINIINDINKVNNDIIILKLNYLYDSIIKIKDEKMTLSNIKEKINQNYSIHDNEYKLLIGETSINDMPDNTPILDILNKYKTKEIIIKTYNNISYIKKQLFNYENFLSKKILLKDEDIKILKDEYEKLSKDLNKI